MCIRKNRAAENLRPKKLTRWVAPWEDPARHAFLFDRADLIVSHSTMEHVDDIDRAYDLFGKFVKTGGWMSHQVDFRSHGFSKIWNGYRGISDKEWESETAGAPYSINREPASRHLELARRGGFEIVTLLSRMEYSGLPSDKVVDRFRNLSAYDARCSGLFFQCLRC